MTKISGTSGTAQRPLIHARHDGRGPQVGRSRHLGKLASNVAILGCTELICRAISVVLMLSLARRLGADGFGRIGFAFNIVFWLVLIVRDCFETVITREIARHPRLTRNLVNHVLAVKLALALTIFAILVGASQVAFSEGIDRWILIFYGLLLLTTALGLDFVFRAREEIGPVAVSLLLRTLIHCVGVWSWVSDVRHIYLVPLWLAGGEISGIALVWVVYTRRFGFPRPVAGLRFLLVLLKRGRSVGLIHLCQAVIASSDLLVVGLMSQWSDVGDYDAPHRIVSAVLAFGMIVQQVVFPALSRSWRASKGGGREILDVAVRVIVSAFIPVAVGGSLLAEPLVSFLFPAEYHKAGLLLAVGIWKAPLLGLAFLYQASLVAMNRESQSVRLLLWGSLCSAPLIAIFHWQFGLPGAAMAVLVIGLGLVSAGYFCLWRAPWRPPAHHHIGRPLLASAFMVPVCLLALQAHVVVAVLAGGVTYLIVLKQIGGLDFAPAQGDAACGLWT